MTAIDPRALRNAFGCFPTGVTVVTTADADGTPRGFTANSFTSVSLDPPLLLVCIANAAASLPVFLSAPNFAVNVLGDGQRAISARFASPSPDKFAEKDWSWGGHGVPLIDGAIGRFECAREQAVEAGDHVIVIGRVVEYQTGDGNPLGFLRGAYVSHTLEQQALDVAAGAEALRVGAVIEADGQVLLGTDPVNGGLRLPLSGLTSGHGSLAALKRFLDDEGVEAAIGFLYALFEEEGGRIQTIFYRGTGSGAAPRRGAYYPLDDLPWDRINDPASRTMLKRYTAEQAAGQFGIYVGDADAGEVRPVAE